MLECHAFVYFKLNIKDFHTLVTILMSTIDHKPHAVHYQSYVIPVNLMAGHPCFIIHWLNLQVHVDVKNG